jgi:hypothetical protein
MSYHRLSCHTCHGLFPASGFAKGRTCIACHRARQAKAQRAYKARKKAGVQAPERAVSASSIVAGTPHEQAQAVCSAEGTVDVFRFASGAITWRRKGGHVEGAEFVGRYDEGSDYRCVVQDLRIAA